MSSSLRLNFDRFYDQPHYREFEQEVNVVLEGESYSNAEMEVHDGHARDLPKLSFRLKFSKNHPPLTNAFTGDSAEKQRNIAALRLDLEHWMIWQGVHTLADNRDIETRFQVMREVIFLER